METRGRARERATRARERRFSVIGVAKRRARRTRFATSNATEKHIVAFAIAKDVTEMRERSGERRAREDGARARTERARARWLSGPEVTIVTRSRTKGMRRKASEETLRRAIARVESEDDRGRERAGAEAKAEANGADAFVTWMLDAQKLAPEVFARELRFKRDFSMPGAKPYTRAMEEIDGWVETNVRRLRAEYGDGADDGWRSGVPFLDPDSVRMNLDANAEDDVDVNLISGEANSPLASASPKEISSTTVARALVAAERFEPTPFPALPLELLPVQHFVLGLWSKAGQKAPSDTDSFALPWLDKSWIDVLHSSASTPRKKRARVWRGKNLDLIVYGEDEKQTWASKIAAFLKRARSALGNRALDRTSWGGSILDSLIGANLTQNVADVLSSTAFMHLAARFPAVDSAVAAEHEGRLLIRNLVVGMFERLNPPSAPTMDTEALDEGVIDDDAPLQPFDSPPRKAIVKMSKDENRTNPNPKSATDGDFRSQQEIIASVIARHDPPPTQHTRDQVNWYAVAEAPLVEIVKCIRVRGMHWMLARRIKGILKRILEQRGILSLEFLRDTPTKDASEYLLALDGMGVKTTSCVLLLALHRTDFPVDVNVGRIMARLGWVPLESETALEMLSQYAPEPAVYTFLRERLNSFSVELLYELHYHMITLGKVFCGKRLPNCGACPLRDICEYAKQGGKCVDRPDGHSGLSSLQPEAQARPHIDEDIEDLAPEQPRKISNVHKNLEKMNDSSALLSAIIAAGKVWDKKGRPNGSDATNVLLLSAMTSRDDITLAYVRLSRVVHPDKNQHPSATVAFQYITAARKVALNISTEDVYQQNIEAELEEMIQLADREPEEAREEGLTGMELSEAVINASKKRVETMAWSVPPEMLPKALTEALGGEINAHGCLMTSTDVNLPPLEKVTNEFIECAIFVSCRGAMGCKFPLHGTYFQVNVRFSRFVFDHRKLTLLFYTGSFSG